MSSTFNEETAQVYGNIMDEARKRLSIIEGAFAAEVETTSLEYIGLSDLCSLQFRKVFEAIGLGCLLVHGDLEGTNRISEHYRADKILKGLEKLHGNFYPIPCKIDRSEGEIVQAHQAVAGEWLTKERLISLYYKFDGEMHVGKLKDRTLQAHPVSRESLTQILNWTWALLYHHLIHFVDGKTRLVVDCSDPSEIRLNLQTLD